MLGWFCLSAVVCAVQWSACPPVGCVGPRWPFGVGSGCSGCFGPASHAFVVHRPLLAGACFGVAWPSSWGGASLGGGEVLKTGTTCPVPPWSQRYMPNPSSCTSRCPSAFLSVPLVPIVCTPPSVAKPLRSSSVHPCVPYGSPGVLCLRGGAVFVLVSAGPSPWLRPRGAGLAVFRVVSCSAALVVCAPVPECGCRRSGWFGLVGRRPLA